jgi:post-GPI attachment to proteins factor 3
MDECLIPSEILHVSPLVDRLLGWSPAGLRDNREFIWAAISKRDFLTKEYGKYAFIRVAHSQEIVSSIFSLLTAISAMAFLHRALFLPGKPLYKFALILFLSSSTLCWTASFVFHVRDCWMTQCLDYLLAFTSILLLTYLSLIRTSLPKISLARAASLLAALALVCVSHTYYMVSVHFSFPLHTGLCALFVAANFILWHRWFLAVRKRPYSRLLLIFCQGTLFSLFFHMIDFGPMLFLVDSHSLWHLLSFVFSHFLFSFLLFDLISTRKDCGGE